MPAHLRWLPFLLLFALACGERESAPAPAPSAPAPSAPAASAPAPAPAAAAAAVAEAEQIFATRCTTCHGSAGAGDGPGSAALEPKPRNFQDPAWQDSVSDDHIEKIIMYGGAAVGRSPTMPGNPDLMSKPEVVRALAAHVRGLARR
jgi:mono/diheme cytochrome c family protein